MYIEESYSVKRKENVVIFESPEFLSKENVEEFLAEVEKIINDMNKRGKKCAIVLDFSKLNHSSMEISQMAEFVTIMAKNQFKKLYAIPPTIPTSGDSQIVTLLNKSLPMFGKNGIKVVIEKPDMDVAFYLYPSFV